MRHRKRVSQDTRLHWWEIEESDDLSEVELIQQSVIRMTVYDAAPPRLRRLAREKGDGPLVQWWSNLHYFDRIRILECAQEIMRIRGK